jgi:hypothetical protein
MATARSFPLAEIDKSVQKGVARQPSELSLAGFRNRPAIERGFCVSEDANATVNKLFALCG